MFVLFPRIGPLWGVPQDGAASTGLSNSMALGSLSEVALDDSVALRIRFDGTPPAPETMYFRGPVFARFDGREWRALTPSFPVPLQPRAELRVAGPALGYEMTLEPTRLATLPLLEATPQAPQIDNLRLTQRDDLAWVADRPVYERLRFRAAAYTTFRHGPVAPVLGLQDHLDLPAGYNPRTLAWAAALRRDARYAQADARTLAAALMQHIRSGRFSYTLSAGPYGTDAIDEFWLDRQEGFCEHYAAAFVVVMRALDVPARVVTGYQGVEPVPVDGYHLVRQSSAHAWAEYWQAGIGWVRADPTAAVAPERISRSRRLIAAPGLIAGTIGSVSPALLASLRDSWEAVNNRWNQWVMNYSRGRQFDALRGLGFDAPSWEDLSLLLIGALSTLALAGAAWAWWDRHRIDPWVRQMERLRRSVRRLNLAAAAHDAPRALALRLREHYGADGEPLAALLDTLERQRYSSQTAARPDTRLTRRFITLARQLAISPSPSGRATVFAVKAFPGAEGV
jgi:protein-glutamine gamma-glutamyltransferase